MPLEPGTLLDGKYAIEALIAELFRDDWRIMTSLVACAMFVMFSFGYGLACRVHSPPRQATARVSTAAHLPILDHVPTPESLAAAGRATPPTPAVVPSPPSPRRDVGGVTPSNPLDSGRSTTN